MKRYSALASAFVVGYLLLDLTSQVFLIREMNLPPWNPAAALALLFLVQHGRHAIPAVFLAILLGDLHMRTTPAALPAALLIDALRTAGYVAIAHALRQRFPDGGVFADRHSLLRWMLAVILGTLANGMLHLVARSLAGELPDESLDILLHFWAGDAVGIFVTMPLLWWLIDRPKRRIFLANAQQWETVAHIGLTAIALWIAFGIGAEANYRYFYFLFIPVVWAASRQGLAGALLSALLLQIGMLLAGSQLATEDISVFEVQSRAFLIALVGFLIGVAVDDHRRVTAELRESLRLAAAGEMAAALAHELNQPLTALTAYGLACEKLIARPERDAQLHEVVKRMVYEANRAAEVVRRLRDFFRSGSIHLEPIRVPDLVAAALQPFREKAAARNIDLAVHELPGEAVLNGDRLQLEVVLRNLIANAFDALDTQRGAPARITVRAQLETGNRINLTVEDTGPGPDTAALGKLFEPFASTKSSGLGLGLAISRAIAEAHGGQLNVEPGDHGCFHLVLPLESHKV